MKLTGPFKKSGSYSGDWKYDVKRDVKIESPELEKALSDTQTEVPKSEMDGTHVFTLACSMYSEAGDPSVGVGESASVEEWEAIGVDGLYFANQDDVKVATAFVEITDAEREAIEEDYLENYEPPFDEPGDFDYPGDFDGP